MCVYIYIYVSEELGLLNYWGLEIWFLEIVIEEPVGEAGKQPTTGGRGGGFQLN